MAPRSRKRHSRSPIPPPQNQNATYDMPLPRQPLLSPGISTSLDSIQITPRTPRAFRPDYGPDDPDADKFVGGVDAEEVEMNLLGEDDRRRAHPGFADGNGHLGIKHKAPLSLEDKRAMALLCVLCTSLSSLCFASDDYISGLPRRPHPGRPRAFCLFSWERLTFRLTAPS